MLKRVFSILLVLCFLFSLCACEKRAHIEKPANFYYLSPEISFHREDGMITAEKREIAGIENNIHTILAMYLQGPEGEGFVSPFPNNVYVVNVTQNTNILSITLSDQFASLTGYDLSLACACITLTVQELMDTQLVQISAQNKLLDGAERITMNKDSLVVFDDPLATVPKEEP